MKKWFLILAGAGLLTIVVWLTATPTGPIPIHFTNGARGSVVKVEYGTNFSYSTETNLLRRLREPLRRFFPRMPRSSDMAGSSKYPALRLWIEEQHPQSATKIGQPSAPFHIEWNNFRIVVQDENRTFAVMGERSMTSRPNKGQDKIIYGFPMGNFPHRSKRLQISFYDYEYLAKCIGTVTIPNPAPQDFSEWQAERLPVTKKDRGLEVTLTRYRCGVVERNLSPVASEISTNGESREEASFEMLENGRHAEDGWHISRFEREDATGNQAPSQLPSANISEWQRTCRMQSFFLPTESAVKLRVDFTRVKQFSADELLSFKPVAVPSARGFTTNAEELSVHGIKVKLIGMVSPLAGRMTGTDTLPGHVSKLYPGDNWYFDALCFQCQPENGKHRLRVIKVVDENGDSLTCQGFAAQSGEFIVGLDYQITAKTLQVVLGVTDTRSFEFTFKPEWVATNCLIGGR